MTAGRALLRLLAAPYKPRAGMTLAGPKMLPDDAGNDTKREGHNQQFHASLGVPGVSAFHAAAVAILIALSGCASNPPVLDNAFCRLYQRLPDPSDAVNLKLRANKVAILTNEQAYIDFCQGKKDFGGPR